MVDVLTLECTLQDARYALLQETRRKRSHLEKVSRAGELRFLGKLLMKAIYGHGPGCPALTIPFCRQKVPKDTKDKTQV